MSSARNVLVLCIGAAVMVGATSIGAATDPPNIEELIDVSLNTLGDPPVRDPIARKAAMLERLRRSKTAMSNKAKKPGVVRVNCDKGDSLQEAIDESRDPVVIEVNGLCHENVMVRNRHGLTIRGDDPALDGIRGMVADPQPSALEFRYSDDIRIENLSMNDSPFAGINARSSYVTAEYCHFKGNADRGISVNQSVFEGIGLTVAENGRYGLRATSNSWASCVGCRVEGNVSFAVASFYGSVVTMWQTVISGVNGMIAAIGGAYADIDCHSQRDAYPEYPDCSLHVDRWAAIASSDAEAVMYASGPFTGAVEADTRGMVYLHGGQQQSSELGFPNLILDDSALLVSSFREPNGDVIRAVLTGPTDMYGFSRALLVGDADLDGTVQCFDAADAFAEPTIQYTEGSGYCGCEHAPLPDACP